MSLYVRLQTSFWTHRKTVRLRARLGDDALWLPPRLWSYAAENQPDGDFSNYSAQEIAMLVGYAKDACVMLEALQQAGFMDGMLVHGWEEYNAYHSVYAERARTAAAARWAKKSPAPPRKERKGKETSNASSILEACGWVEGSEIKTVFTRWIEVRSKAKKPADGDWTRFFKAQADWLKTFPESVAVESMQTSLRNGWQGLFEPKQQGGKQVAIPAPPAPTLAEWAAFIAQHENPAAREWTHYATALPSLKDECRRWLRAKGATT